METNNIDSKFKNIISENQDFYNSQADAAKNNIWAGISTKKKKKTSTFLIYSLSAACIALLLLSTVLGISLLNYKNYTQQTPLNLETAKNHSEYFLRKRPIYKTNTEITTDTVFLTRTEIINQPVEITNTIIDTVFINQIEYIEISTQIDNYVIEENLQLPNNQYDNYNSTEVLINNSEAKEDNEKPKLRFRFGRNNNQSGNSSLALTTNL